MNLDRLYRDVENLKTQYKGLAGGPQLALSSIENGSIDSMDADGNLKMTIGEQDDGGNTIHVISGPTPPTPVGFTVDVDHGKFIVHWSGDFDGDALAPSDWSRAEVHASQDPFFVPDRSTARGSIVSAAGGEVTIGVLKGPWTIKMLAWSQAGKMSTPSSPVDVEVPGYGEIVLEHIDASETEIKNGNSILVNAQETLGGKLSSAFGAIDTINEDLDDLGDAVEGAVESANGKNTVHYGDQAPTTADEGIEGDTWFVGQVGRPNDVVEATNLAKNPTFQGLLSLDGARNISNSAGAALSIDNSWSSSGSGSLKVTSTGALGSAAYVLNQSDAPSAADAGKTFTMSCDIRLTAAQINPGANARTIVIGYRNTSGAVASYGIAFSNQAPNTPGVHRVKATFTLPADFGGWLVRCMSDCASGSVWFDSFMWREGSVDSPYFDGDTPNPAITNLAPNPVGPTATTADGFRGSSDTFNFVNDITPAIEAVQTEAGTSLYTDPNVDFGAAQGLAVGKWVALGVDAKAVNGFVDTPSAPVRFSSYSGAAQTGGTVRGKITNEWSRLTRTMQVTALPAGGYFRALLWPSDPQLGAAWRHRRWVVAVADTEAEAQAAVSDFFEGTKPDLDKPHYRWTGTPHASTSEKYLPALDIGDDTTWNVTEQWRFQNGEWVQVELSHTVLSSLDLGKLVAGSAAIKEAVVQKLFAEVVVQRMSIADEFIGENAILTGAVTAPKITASEELWAKLGQFVKIRAEHIQSDALDSMVITGGTYRTTGGNGSWSDSGLFINESDGTSLVRFPTDGSPLSLSASDTQIDRASVGELDVTNGEVRSSGTMTLAAGVTAPASPPELAAAWKREAQLPRPPEVSMDWTGLAYWNGLYVRGVNVLTSAGDPYDRIELYNPNGTLNRSINIDLNPRAGVAVIGDIVYTVGPDHVERSGAERQWCHGFNLNTGARVSRWEFVNFFATNQAKIALGTDGTNLVAAGVAPNAVLSVFKYNPSTGAAVGSQLTDTGWNISARELFGVHQSGSDIYITHKGSTRVYTVSGSTLSRKAGSSNGTTWAGWANPNKNAGGMAVLNGVPVLADSGAVYTGSKFTADATVQACFTWTNGVQETTPSPITVGSVFPRESVTISLPKREGLQKNLYLKSSLNGGAWTRTTIPVNTTSITVVDIQAGLYGLPTSNTFPASTPAVLKSGVGNLELRGDGSGRIGPLTFHANGSMTGIPKMAHGKIAVSVPANTTTSAAVTLPAGMFTTAPDVVVTAGSSSPYTSVQGVSVNNITPTSFDVFIRRSNSDTTGIHWIAMGE